MRFNNHFSAVCQNLPPCLSTFALCPSHYEKYQVAGMLRFLKTERSSTPWDLPAKIYQEFSYELATPLTSNINTFLTQSTCPSDWKTSYITAIPKVTKPTLLHELRPIAVTPVPACYAKTFC